MIMHHGQGALLITNAVDPAGQEEFDEWYIREHLPERVGGPGFLRGRRFRRITGTPRFMALYETETPEVLQAPPLLERLNNPTPWTQGVMPYFRDMHRTIMRVAATHGTLDGGLITLIDLTGVEETTLTALAGSLSAVAQEPGICAAHLWRKTDFAPPQTAEMRLRGAPDRSLPAALGIEGTDAKPLEAVLEQIASQLPVSARASAQTFRLLCALSAN
jgi:hypothetical protein